MLLVWILSPFIWLANQVVNLLPVADVQGLASNMGPAETAFCYSAGLNSVFPVTEALTALGLLCLVYAGMHSAGAIRRVWSLISGGGGA
jgi:hypothetical protein